MPSATDLELHRHARHDLHVEDRRGVVPRVHTLEWRADDRGAEVSLRVALPDALVDRVGKAAARDVHVLPQLDEADDRARVLAVRDLLGPRELRVVLEDLEHVLAGR